MRQAEPLYPWETAQPAHVLVASALAFARPVALAQGPPRLNGLDDEHVGERYRSLRIALADADPAVAPRLEELEAAPDAGYQPWLSPLLRSTALDDARVIQLAHAVWEALGANEYAVQLRERRRSYRGFAEGRSWMAALVIGLAAAAVASGAAQDRWGGPAWAVGLVIAAAWVALVAGLFARRYQRLLRRGDRELPHF